MSDIVGNPPGCEEEGRNPASGSDNLKARRAIRSFCVSCQGGAAAYVEGCKDSVCRLYLFRLYHANARPEWEAAPEALPERPLRAIRRHCMICADGRADVRACAARADCPLWSFRFGVKPETYRKIMDRFYKPKTLLLPGFTLQPKA